MPEHYPIVGGAKFRANAKVWFLYCLDFITYPAVAVVLAIALYWIWLGIGLAPASPIVGS